MPTEFTPLLGFVGGLLIGIASILMVFGIGRIAGISGIFAGLIPPLAPDRAWRILFLIGLVSGALIWSSSTGRPLPVNLQTNAFLLVIAGFFVGLGSRLASGCTSGHGISGIARLSMRSFVATFTFVFAGMIATYLMRHIFGGAP